MGGFVQGMYSFTSMCLRVKSKYWVSLMFLFHCNDDASYQLEHMGPEE